MYPWFLSRLFSCIRISGILLSPSLVESQWSLHCALGSFRPSPQKGLRDVATKIVLNGSMGWLRCRPLLGVWRHTLLGGRRCSVGCSSTGQENRLHPSLRETFCESRLCARWFQMPADLLLESSLGQFSNKSNLRRVCFGSQFRCNSPPWQDSYVSGT